MVLVDSDVINLVNLRFLSEYHAVAAEVVMDMRGQGQKFVVINDEIRKGKERHGDDNGGKGKGKAKGEGIGKGSGNDCGGRASALPPER